MGILRMTRRISEDIRKHCADGYPDEACGLLVGTIHASGKCNVSAMIAMKNVAPSPQRRFELDPKQQLIVQREIEERGLETVGYFHSHPDSPAVPSETDIAGAWPVYRYIIVSVISGTVEQMRCWVFDDANVEFNEHQVESVDI